jgi:hypothetical protein
VNDLSAEAVNILCAYHQQLQEQHIKLVLVHASDGIQHELLDAQPVATELCFAPTLFDAAWHSGLRLTA